MGAGAWVLGASGPGGLRSSPLPHPQSLDSPSLFLESLVLLSQPPLQSFLRMTSAAGSKCGDFS